MTKTNYSINSYADLNREELRVKKRLKKQEELIKLQLKTLPEEIVTVGISKVISGILSGNLFQQAGTVVGLVKGLFQKKTESSEGEESQGGGIMDILKTVLKNKFSK
jgi:hypothetical protein